MVFLGIGVNLALKFEKTSMRKISKGLLLFLGFLLGVTVNSNAQTAIIASPNPVPLSICNGDTIHFVADNSSGTLTSFQWNFNGAAAGPQTVFGQNVTFVSGNVGTYTMQLVVSDGIALDTLDFNMVVNACTPPTINISGTPTTICEGTQVQFTDATTPGSQPITSRLWSFPGGTPATANVANPSITYATAGTYNVFYEVTDANGTYKDTLVAYINVVSCPPPVADFIANKVQICPGDCINFLDQSQNVVVGQSTWSWSFPGSDSSVSVQQNPTNICYQIPGKYTVTLSVTNAFSGDTEEKINYITVDSCLPPESKYSAEKLKICQGTCVQFFNQSLRADTVTWHFFNADPLYEWSTEDDPIVCYSDTGKFDIQMVTNNQYGPPSILLHTEVVDVEAFPEVQAPNDESVLIGQSVRLQAYGTAPRFRWTPSDGTIDCETCSRVNVSPLENTKYYVTNISDNGCERTDSVNVIVVKNYYRGVPDAFTPNADEENDVLLVYGNGITKMEFYVYDRHGRLVFESRDQNVGWDGTYKGEPLQGGVYAYFVKLTYESGFQEILKGDVTLVR